MYLKLFFTAFALICTTVPVILAQSLHQKIADRLMYQPSASDVVVHFKSHPGFQRSELPVLKEYKGVYVYQTLKAHAATTQREIVDLLKANRVEHKQFCVANAVWIKSEIDIDVLLDIAGFEDVDYISWNEPVAMSRIRQSEPVSKSAGIEWGIERIRADSVWMMGFTGQGIVVGGQDTGYEWDHPAISRKYRGNLGDSIVHNYNWYDAIHELSPLHDDMITNPGETPCGVDALEPCDDHGHGTHTMGTIVGGDEGDMLGVAPDAKWIGVRCMDRGYGSPMTYLEAFEWFLAPTDVNGENPDPTLAPHVINNSWRCPAMEGCNPDNYGLLEQAINNLRAAGVVVVVSAGNEGAAGCSSLADPPSIFEGSFAVGAIKQNDTIANFSSRGPIMVDSSGRIKPDVSAPGVAVRSAWLDSSYRYLNGTSMAGPHVAGAVALMISANPELSGQVELIEEILRETARPMKPLYECASDSLAIPNNSYGYGIIDALAAVERALEVTSTDRIPGVSRNLTLFPNPSSGAVNYILSAEVNQHVLINVFDMTGALVASFDDLPGTGQIFLDAHASGVYAVIVVDKGSGEIYSDKVFIRP